MLTKVAVFFVAVLLVTFVGCNLNTDYFSDYRSKNLLGNSDFSTGKWALASDSNSANTTYNPTPTQFMNWAAASSDASLPAAYLVGPDGNPAYRLEILNLIPDGDFENALDTGTGATNPLLWNPIWTLSQATTTPPFDLNFNTSGTDSHAVPLSVAHNTLSFGNVANQDALTIALYTAVGTTLWARPAGYQFLFDFYNASSGSSLTVTLTQPTATDPGEDWKQTGLSHYKATLYELSKYFTTDASSPATTVTIGTSNGETDAAYIDNVRMVNTSIDPSTVLALSSLSSGTAQLLPGTKSGAYTFSVYVRDDPTADQTSTLATHSLNRFYASGLSIFVAAAVKSGSGTYSSFAARPNGGWTGWTKVTVNFGFDFVDSDGALGGKPALAIHLSPTNTVTGTRDVGSLLVAEPTLVYNP